MPRADLLPEARQDFEDALAWYAARNREVAVAFVGAVDDSLAAICRHPDFFRLIDDQHRVFTMRRFPYRIVYRTPRVDLVLVVAIAHAKRRPGYWRGRQ